MEKVEKALKKENKNLLNTSHKPADGYWECDDDGDPFFVRV